MLTMLKSMITRFAPSPTGFLHLGHAYAAWVAACWGSTMLLRHEDIDIQLSRDAYVQQIEQDLAWLDIAFQSPALRQTDNSAKHHQALQALIVQGCVYPCFCSRSDIRRAARAPHLPKTAYPGTCRQLNAAQRDQRMQHAPYAYRLDMQRALQQIHEICFIDKRFGAQSTAQLRAQASAMGDVVISRKDGSMSYHLAVVVDDADQGIDLVTRGEDLLAITPVHVVLQRLLGLPTPLYLHHHLVRDENGVRLAKRDDARALQHYRQHGYTPAQIMHMLPHAPEDLPPV